MSSKILPLITNTYKTTQKMWVTFTLYGPLIRKLTHLFVTQISKLLSDPQTSFITHYVHGLKQRHKTPKWHVAGEMANM